MTNKTHYYIFIALLLCMVLVGTRAGAIPVLEANGELVESGLSYRRFTTNDGLPQMQTEIVWQDECGYIYIGTLSGFARFDGLTLTPFLKGRRENIVGFQEVNGHARALGFVRQWDISGTSTTMVPIDPLGHMLLNNFNAADLPPGHVLLEDKQEQNRMLCRVDNDGMHSVMEHPLFDEMTPDRKMFIDTTGVYVPTPHGLYVVELGSEADKSRQLTEKDDVFSLIRTGRTLFAFAADGIYTVGHDSLTLLLSHHFEAPDYGLFVRQNRQGQLLIADSHTIWLYDATAPTAMRQLATGFNLIKGLFVDKWNRLWAATYQGAYCFFCCSFVNYRLTDSNDIIRAIATVQQSSLSAERAESMMVLGTLNGKVLVGGNLVSSIDGNFYAPSAVSIGDKVYMAGNGDIVALQDSSLHWLGLPYDKYQFVARYAGHLIIGTRNSILAYHPDSGQLDTLTNDIARPWCAADDGQGRLWVSGNSGLYCLTEGTMEKVKSTSTSLVISALASDEQGHVAFALGDSLFAISHGEVRLMDEAMPMLADHEIRTVHVSPRGYIVVAAIDGLLVARIDRDCHASDIHWFDAKNGFTMIEPQKATMAESSDGTVWLAGLEEMTSFRPEDLLADYQQSTVVEAPLLWWQRWWVWVACIALLALAVWRMARWFELRQAQKKMALLEREKKQKELQLSAVRLKAIPHFHSNVLASIEYFVMNNSGDEASHYLKLYSDFTNRTLSDIDRPSRSVADEVDYVRTYLELERLRYGERLRYNINVASDVDLGVMLPTMLLHTYCQNAVKHGIAAKVGVGSVQVAIRRQQCDSADGILVAVSDDGVGRSEAAQASIHSTKQGLKILQQQIELYNQANKHKITQHVTDLTDNDGRPAGTCFEIWVPADYKY